MTIKYENSKVYKIWSPSGDKIYVGSTTKEYLSQRMTAHRTNYNRWKLGVYGYITAFLIFDEYGLDNCFIELLEAKSCKSKDELNQLEGGYIRNLNCVNKKIEGRTRKQYKEENKEYIKEQQRVYDFCNKDKKKVYMEENKEHFTQVKKLYYESNKHIQNPIRNQKHLCSCGKEYSHSNKSRHEKSVFHLNNKKE